MTEERKKHRFKKGWEGGPGRPEGSKNKLSKEVKDTFQFVFNNFTIKEKDPKTGQVTRHKGKHAILYWANKNPDEFITKIAVKMLPKPVEVSGADGGPIKHATLVLLSEKKKLIPDEKIVYDPEIRQIELDEEDIEIEEEE